MTIGGEEPPLNIGENSPFLIHEIEDQKEVKQLLKETNLNFKQISQKTGYCESSITRINQGKLWKDENESYPLRKDNCNLSKIDAKKRILQIIFDLQNTDLTQKAIAEKYGMCRSAITAINIGQNGHQKNINYPIRKNSKKSTKPLLMIDPNTDEILKEFSSAKEAIQYLGINNKDGIYQCARGEIHTSNGYKWKYK